MRRKILLSRIKSSIACDWNLNATEVESHRIQYGPNDIVESRSNRWLELAMDTIKDPMIWFLIGVSALFALLKNYNQATILILATIPLIGMDAFLHWRTQTSTRSLRQRLATDTVVIRSNLESKIPAQEIVPGDLIVISAGSFIPADGIVVAGKDLQVDESALTGEAFPVQKKILTLLPPSKSDPNIDDHYWGFAGTRLLTGHALLRVVYTGKETLYGEIITSAQQTTHTKTPIQYAIAKLVLALIVAATLLCIILAGVRYYQGFGFIDAILSAATLAVAALPDEFPVVFTFFLGIGVYRLAQKKALVRRAVSVENIGRITCICSDKTGTMTEGQFHLSQYLCALTFNDSSLLYLGIIASRIESGDPIDLAIAETASKLQLPIPERIITFPFTEDRKRETAVVSFAQNQQLIATKGAPETILALSTLTDDEKQDWITRISKLASTGYKVIACAQYLTENKSVLTEPQTGYQFAGLLAFSDPPRAEVPQALQECLASGIHVLMITGDHPETARAIAKEIGLGAGNPKVILAEEIETYRQKNDTDFFRTVDVIARAVPAQKLAIVNALKNSGEIVAATGDGVNDVPALKASDIGIAMGERGTQSAREVSDIVLLDDNFSSIVNAIAEGRQLFINLKLSFKYLLLIHMPFVISAAVIPLLGYPLLYFPIHIVWIELLIHPTSMLVFQDLPQDKKLKPITREKKIRFFSRRDWLGLMVTGIFATIFVILSYILIIKTSNNAEHARAFALASLGFMSAALTFSLSNFRTFVAKVTVIATLVFSIVFTQIPLIAKFLYLTPLHLRDWVIISLASIIVLFLAKL